MTLSDVLLRIAIALPFGLLFGSFLTVAIQRLPAGESLVRPRFRCPSCGTPLRTLDIIPVVSWPVTGWRCHACGARISSVYSLTVVATGGLFAAVALVYDDPWRAILLAPFGGVLVALSIIDIKVKRLPNRLVYPSILIAVPYILVADLAGGHLDAVRAGIGFLAYGVGLLIVALVAPMGMGDVKLAGLIGLVLGSIGLGVVAVAAGVGILLGGVGALVALLSGAGRKSKLPYGPFMAGGALVAVFVGQQIANAYIDLIS
jgi:leader peptidase (prepilin peptidase) / N-methyltransferase